MRANGFEPDFSPQALREADDGSPDTRRRPSDANERAPVYFPAGTSPRTESGAPTGALQDLRDLLWSSIDNAESRDLDQVEVAERLSDGAIRVLVGIADVDRRVPPGSAIDAHAARNTVTVYTGVVTFAMLPETLSTDQTSLLGEADRAAIVMDMTVNAQGKVTASQVYPALIRNHARLNYDEVGTWLEGRGPIPPHIAEVAGMEAQIRLQDEAAQRLQSHRREQGALEFESVEAQPVVENGRVVRLAVPDKNRARYLIENFMVAANSAMAEFLAASGLPSIQRVVRSPERWPRIVEIAAQLGETLPDAPDAPALAAFLERRKQAAPDQFPDLSLAVVKLLGPGQYALVDGPEDVTGHFGLAVRSYTHSTAPNRRFVDLVTQRLLKAAHFGQTPPYTPHALEQIAAHCTERESAARKVERMMRKVLAAALFQNRIGETFPAIITGIKAGATYVRVVSPPVEGRLVRGETGLDVGDRLRVRLIGVDVAQGYIDFERAPNDAETDARSSQSAIAVAAQETPPAASNQPR